MGKIDWKNADEVRTYNAQKQREWRQRNPEKAAEAQLRQVQRRLERIRQANAIKNRAKDQRAVHTERHGSEGCEA